MLKSLSLLFLSVSLVENVRGIFENCDFYQKLELGKSYSIFSPGYPQYYTPGLTCRWVADSPVNTQILLSCTDFYVPASEDCWKNSFTVSKSGRVDFSDGSTYCGKGTFEALSLSNRLSVVLLTSTGSAGKFFCNVTIKEPAASPSKDSCSCGNRNSMRIVGGKETGVNEYPMMAALVDGRLSIQFCGGTIISERYVLTAAHCLAEQRPEYVGVLVGDHDTSVGSDTDSAKLYLSSSFSIHPNYNTDNQQNDIALIRTKKPIAFSMQVGPACLPIKEVRSSFTGETVYAVGWGTTSFGGSTSPKLRHVPLGIVAQRKCYGVYGSLFSDKQICTYSDNKDACQSDSGGPLLWKDPKSNVLKVVGIISYGVQCATENPSVNTRVAYYVDWIKKTTGEEFCIK